MGYQIETKRLLLRPIEMEDCERINLLINDPTIFAYTVLIPYPCSIEQTKKWIQDHKKNVEDGKTIGFAIIVKERNELIGLISIEIEKRHFRGEVGYWIGKAYRNAGYCSEATKAVVQFCLAEVHLHRVYATIMRGNIGSKKVLRNAGLKLEGCLKDHIVKNNEYKDLEYYGIIGK